MNNYISLDGKKYVTPNKFWTPYADKPATVKLTLMGTVDVTYGPAVYNEWHGQIEAPTTIKAPMDGTWGLISDLRATCQELNAVAYIDHYGTVTSVHVLGPFQERSISPKWDAPTNKILITVRLVKA